MRTDGFHFSKFRSKKTLSQPANCIALQDSNDFSQQVLHFCRPVLVDFTAPWCGPCKTQLPVLYRVAARFPDQIIVLQIDIDQHPSIATQYKVMSIPTLLLFHHGQVVESFIGCVKDSTINTAIAGLFDS